MHLSSASQQMLVLICLVGFLCVFTSGVISHDPKKTTCCKEHLLTEKEPRVKIIKCCKLRKTAKCVEAVGLTDTKNRMYCIDPKAVWLEKRIETLEKRGVKCE